MFENNFIVCSYEVSPLPLACRRLGPPAHLWCRNFLGPSQAVQLLVLHPPSMNNPNRSVWSPLTHLQVPEAHYGSLPCGPYQAPLLPTIQGIWRKLLGSQDGSVGEDVWCTCLETRLPPPQRGLTPWSFPLTSMVYCGMRTHTYSSHVHACTHVNNDFKKLGLASGSEHMGRSTGSGQTIDRCTCSGGSGGLRKTRMLGMR